MVASWPRIAGLVQLREDQAMKLDTPARRHVIGMMALQQWKIGIRRSDFETHAFATDAVDAVLQEFVTEGIFVVQQRQTGSGGTTESFYSLAEGLELRKIPGCHDVADLYDGTDNEGSDE